MPRQFKDRFEAVRYFNRLPAIQARIEADQKRAMARGDFARAYRHAMRVYMVESRFMSTAPMELGTYHE